MHFPIRDREIDREGARRAELVVFKQEKEKLQRLGRQDLARKVKDVSRSTGYGYDIQSYSDNGRLLRIEVKSTSGKRIGNFVLTSSEWTAAKMFKKTYHVYIVFQPRTKFPEILPLANFSSLVNNGRIRVEPFTYIAQIA